MARYIVSYRILRYCGRIVAHLYRDNYPSNDVDIPHNSQECCHHHVAVNAVGDIDKGSLVQRGGRRAISVTFNTPAGKVTLIGGQ